MIKNINSVRRKDSANKGSLYSKNTKISIKNTPSVKNRIPSQEYYFKDEPELMISNSIKNSTPNSSKSKEYVNAFNQINISVEDLQSFKIFTSYQQAKSDKLLILLNEVHKEIINNINKDLDKKKDSISDTILRKTIEEAKEITSHCKEMEKKVDQICCKNSIFESKTRKKTFQEISKEVNEFISEIKFNNFENSKDFSKTKNTFLKSKTLMNDFLNSEPSEFFFRSDSKINLNTLSPKRQKENKVLFLSTLQSSTDELKKKKTEKEKDTIISKLNSTITSQSEKLTQMEIQYEISKANIQELIKKNSKIENELRNREIDHKNLKYLKSYSYLDKTWVFAKLKDCDDNYIWVNFDKSKLHEIKNIVKLNEIEEKQEKLLNENSSLKNNLNELKDNLRQLLSLNEENESIIKQKKIELNELKSIVENRDKEIVSINKNNLKEIREIKKKHMSEIKDLKVKLESKSKEIFKLSQEIKKLNEKSNCMADEIQLKKGLSNSNVISHDENTIIKAKYQSCNSEIDKIQQEIQSELEDKIDLKESEVGKLRLIINNKDKEISEFIDQLAELKIIISEKNNKIEEKLKENEELNQKIKEQNLKMIQFEKNYNDTRNQNEMIIENLYEQNKNLADQVKASEIKINENLSNQNELQERLNELSNVVDNQNTEIESYKDSLKLLKEKNQEKDEKITKLQRGMFNQKQDLNDKIELESKNRLIDILTKQLNELKIKFVSFEEDKKNTDKLIQEKDEFIKKSMEEFETSKKQYLESEKLIEKICGDIKRKDGQIEQLNKFVNDLKMQNEKWKEEKELIEKNCFEKEKSNFEYEILIKNFTMMESETQIKLKSLQEKLNEKVEIINGLSNNQNSLNSKLLEKTDELNRNNEIINKLNGELRDKENYIDKKNYEIIEIGKKMKEQIDMNIEFSIRNKKNSEIIEEKEKMIQKLIKQMNESNIEISNYNVEAEKLNSVINKLENEIQSLKSLNLNLIREINEKDIENVQDIVFSLRKEIEINIYSDQKNYIEMQLKISQIQEELENKNSEIKKLIQESLVQERKLKEKDIDIELLENKKVEEIRRLKVEKFELRILEVQKLRILEIQNEYNFEIILSHILRFDFQYLESISHINFSLISINEVKSNLKPGPVLIYQISSQELLICSTVNIHSNSNINAKDSISSKADFTSINYHENLKRVHIEKDRLMTERIAELEATNLEISLKLTKNEEIIEELQEKLNFLKREISESRNSLITKEEEQTTLINLNSNDFEIYKTTDKNNEIKDEKIKDLKKNMVFLKEIITKSEKKLRNSTFKESLFCNEIKKLNIEKSKLKEDLHMKNNEIDNITFEKEEYKNMIDNLKLKIELLENDIENKKKEFIKNDSNTLSKNFSSNQLEPEKIDQMKKLIIELEERNKFNSEINENLRDQIRGLADINEKLNTNFDKHRENLNAKIKENHSKIFQLAEENENFKSCTEELKNKLIFLNAVINEKELIIKSYKSKYEGSLKDNEKRILELNNQLELKNLMIIELSSKSNNLEIEKFDALRRASLKEKKLLTERSNRNIISLEPDKKLEIVINDAKKKQREAQELKSQCENLKTKIEYFNSVIQEIKNSHPEINIKEPDQASFKSSENPFDNGKNEVIDFSVIEEEKFNSFNEINKLNGIIAQKDRTIKNLERDLYNYSRKKENIVKVDLNNLEKRAKSLNSENNEENYQDKIKKFSKTINSLKLENTGYLDQISYLRNEISELRSKVNSPVQVKKNVEEIKDIFNTLNQSLRGKNEIVLLEKLRECLGIEGEKKSFFSRVFSKN